MGCKRDANCIFFTCNDILVGKVTISVSVMKINFPKFQDRHMRCIPYQITTVMNVLHNFTQSCPEIANCCFLCIHESDNVNIVPTIWKELKGKHCRKKNLLDVILKDELSQFAFIFCYYAAKIRKLCCIVIVSNFMAKIIVTSFWTDRLKTCNEFSSESILSYNMRLQNWCKSDNTNMPWNNKNMLLLPLDL